MPKLEWYKNAVPLSKLNNPRYKVISSMGLQVRKLQPSDAGIFQCFARNSAGEAQVHTYLDVTSESDPEAVLRGVMHSLSHTLQTQCY